MSFDPDAPAIAEDGLFGLGSPVESAAVVVLPVPVQHTTSYRRGTRGAPAAVLQASHQVDLHDRVTGDAWTAGIAMATAPDWIAARDAELQVLVDRLHAGDPIDRAPIDAFGVRVRDWVKRQARLILRTQQIPAVLGGDHSAPLGLIAALGEQGPLGILHVDAHADLRHAYEGLTYSHASVMWNVLDQVPGVERLVQVGIRDYGQAEARRIERDARIQTWFDHDLAWDRAAGMSWLDQVRRMIDPLPERVHVSFDVDGLQPQLCPGTGTPVPGGLDWHQATVLLHALMESGRRVVGFDLCEVGTGPIDAIVGARLLYRLACTAIRTGD
jgi:agmatinase